MPSIQNFETDLKLLFHSKSLIKNNLNQLASFETEINTGNIDVN